MRRYQRTDVLEASTLRPCDTCTPPTLTYGSPESLTPEMESVWSWFDTVLGVDSSANPRGYCTTVGADR
jgi:hypothetical protein